MSQEHDPHSDEAPSLTLPSPPDEFLDFIVSAFIGTEGENTIGLTVSCGGTIASGTAISRGAWVALLGAFFKENMPAGQGDPIADALGRLQGGFSAAEAKWIEDGHPEPAFGFINMKNVVLLTTGGGARSTPLWRARLDRLDGWSLGAFDGDYNDRRL